MTLIGETTKGGAHLTRFERVVPHFAVSVPVGTMTDPIGKGDWERWDRRTARSARPGDRDRFAQSPRRDNARIGRRCADPREGCDSSVSLAVLATPQW